MSKYPQWITVQEAAELARYHPNHMRRLIRGGAIKARKWATVWQVHKPSLLTYLNKQATVGERRGAKPTLSH